MTSNRGFKNNRIVGSILFVIIVFGLIALREFSLIPFDIFAMVLAAVGSFEIINMLGKNLKRENKVIIFSFIALILPIYYLSGRNDISVFILFLAYFWASAIISIYANEKVMENGEEKVKRNALKNLSAATLAGIYPVLVMALLVLMNNWGDISTVALLLIFTTGPFCDVGAYLFGTTIKGKKLCPTISPNKTISGAIGGILGGIVGGLTVYFLTVYLIPTPAKLENATIIFYIIFGLLASIVTEFGDLVESAIKRSAGFKDSGKFIPGHGGVLDRFDGVMFVTTMAYAYFYLVL